LLSAFSDSIGPSEISADGYFSLNVQPSDMHLMPVRYKALVQTSEGLRKLSGILPLLTKFADSLYIKASRAD
jgi:hypothetical protein